MTKKYVLLAILIASSILTASVRICQADGGGYWRPYQNQTDYSHNLVIKAQKALAQQGIAVGAIDGIWGRQTRAAVLQFQRQSELPITGELDAITKTRLFN